MKQLLHKPECLNSIPIASSFLKSGEEELGRLLTALEHRLLFQKTWAWFSAPFHIPQSGILQPCLTPIPGVPESSSGLCRYQAYTHRRDTYKTLIHEVKIILFSDPGMVVWSCDYSTVETYGGGSLGTLLQATLVYFLSSRYERLCLKKSKWIVLEKWYPR